MLGWTGNILEIDLTRRQFTARNPSAAYFHQCLGGKGIAGEILQPHATKSWDHPDMPLIFATGPLVGTPAPTSGRMVIASRSPLTGTIGDASVGGRLGFHIKRAGRKRHRPPQHCGHPPRTACPPQSRHHLRPRRFYLGQA